MHKNAGAPSEFTAEKEWSCREHISDHVKIAFQQGLATRMAVSVREEREMKLQPTGHFSILELTSETNMQVKWQVGHSKQDEK